ncbi:MAG: hypothetical protein JWQ06_485 [Mucilaginibacter sp.]|nr:hypothetical protein [Mucilaginibacter sp.]
MCLCILSDVEDPSPPLADQDDSPLNPMIGDIKVVVQFERCHSKPVEPLGQWP